MYSYRLAVSMRSTLYYVGVRSQEGSYAVQYVPWLTTASHSLYMLLEADRS